MALPKHIRPEYSTTIPSSGKKIKYMPFTVKEEKILILAAETQDPDEITNAVSNVLRNCVSSPQDFKVEDLALFDIEYLFLKTRAKSAGEKIRVSITDPDDADYTVDHEIDIDKIKVQKNSKHTDTIQISDKVMIKMKYPDITFFNEGIDVTSVDTSLEVISKCISQIVVEEEVYNKADMTEEEAMDWVEGLTSEDFKKIINFFETMPRLSHTITLKNKHTQKNFTVKLEGLQDFF